VGTFGGAVQSQAQVVLELPPRATREWSLIELMGEFRDLNHAYRLGPLEHDVVHVRAQADGAVLDAWHFPAPLPVRRDDGLSIAVRRCEDGGPERVEVAVNRFAQYVVVTQGAERIARTHVAPWAPAVAAVDPSRGPIVVRAANADAVARIDLFDRREPAGVRAELVPAAAERAEKGAA
jgi:beta-mannosidase